MADVQNQTPQLPENPLVGSSHVGAAVSGTAFGAGHVGVLGSSLPPTQTVTNVSDPSSAAVGDGVYGTGLNGIHGVSAYDNGVLGENSGKGNGVTGKSSAGNGVQGTNGTGAGVTPKFGCGVLGESESGYGLYGASKTASAIFGTAPSGHLAGEFDGDVMVTGNVTAADVIVSGADCAEEFDVCQEMAIDPGSVVVFDDEGRLSTTNVPYDSRVAGVVSGAGSFRPGVVLDRRISRRRRLPLALVGKVYCKVDASYAPINVGDWLTTSSTRGHAMKALLPEKAFGTVIGKALARHQSGEAIIPILVTLR
jgi:hypothetical protein